MKNTKRHSWMIGGLLAAVSGTAAAGSPTVQAILAADEMTVAEFVANAKVVNPPAKEERYQGSIAEVLALPEITVVNLLSDGRTTEEILVKRKLVRESVQLAHQERHVTSPDLSPLPEVVIEDDVAIAPIAAAKPVVFPTHLRILHNEGLLGVSASDLIWEKKGDVISVDVTDVPDDLMLTLFVRDPHILEWNVDKLELTGKAKGKTEIYLVLGKQMQIVSAEVASDKGAEQLDVPTALTSLDGVFDANSSTAIFAGVSRATTSDGVIDEETTVAVEASKQETAAAVEAQKIEAATVELVTGQLEYGSIAMQFVDDRSHAEAGLIYPLSGIVVSIVGTEFTGKTDATGHLIVPDVPRDSRLLVRFSDPLNRVRSGFFVTETEDPGVRRVKTLRSFVFETGAQIAGVTQNASEASMCVAIEQDAAPVIDVGVQLDVPADGAFYFNDLGYLDRGMVQTGPDGRACFYNVSPGPVTITLFDGETAFATFPMSAVGGQHTQESVELTSQSHLNLRLVAAANAHEQLAGDPAVASKFTTIDMIDMLPFGFGDPLMQQDFGLLATAYPLTHRLGRALLVSQGAAFESVLYNFKPTTSEQVVQLLPRGFVEDLSLYAQVPFDPVLGVLFVEHGWLDGQGDEQVQIRILRPDGQEVEGGWYFADTPVTKAMFFNLAAGTYVILVETGDGFWLAADVAYVYDETMTYVGLGSRLQMVE